MNSAPPDLKRRRRLVRPEEMRWWETLIVVAGVIGGILVVADFIKLISFVSVRPSHQLLILLQLPIVLGVPWWFNRAHSCGVFLAVSGMKRITWGAVVFFVALGAFYGEIEQFNMNGAWAFPNAHWFTMGPTLMLGAAVEEIWLRGWIYPGLRAHWPLLPSLGCILLIVIVTHPQIWHDWDAATFVCGGHLGFTYLRERYQTTTPGWLAHVVYNGVVSL